MRSEPHEQALPVTPVRRSWLFVPGDSQRKQDKALASNADVVILDLEDSVAAAELPRARERVAQLLRARTLRTGPELWVRVNPPASGQLRADIGEIAAAGTLPDGLVLPKISTAEEIIDVAHYLTTLETGYGRPAGRTQLLVIATETPAGLLALPRYPVVLAEVTEVTGRLCGLTWGAEDLGAALGVQARRDAGGALTFTFQLARSACLLASAALQVTAVDTVYTNFRDAEGLRTELEQARRDGFTGKLAIHPDQVSLINEAFTPSAAERAHAERVVAAFAAAAGAGVASLDGQMIDRPHLLQAQRVLAASGRGGQTP